MSIQQIQSREVFTALEVLRDELLNEFPAMLIEALELSQDPQRPEYDFALDLRITDQNRAKFAALTRIVLQAALSVVEETTCFETEDELACRSILNN